MMAAKRIRDLTAREWRVLFRFFFENFLFVLLSLVSIIFLVVCMVFFPPAPPDDVFVVPLSERASLLDVYLLDGRTVGLSDVSVLDVSCVSESMAPLFRCGDQALAVPVGPDDMIIPGEVYIFESGFNSSVLVMHRLVGCSSPSCATLLFKGDNNALLDLKVSRSSVRYWVRGALYAVRRGVELEMRKVMRDGY